MVIKNWGATCALLSLVALAAFCTSASIKSNFVSSVKSTSKTSEREFTVADLQENLKPYSDIINISVAIGGLLASFATAMFTGFLASRTNGLYEATQGLQNFAALQSMDAKDAIREAVRSADAMQHVAGSLQINAQQIIESVEINRQIGAQQREHAVKQMRAYLAVRIGAAIYQETAKNLRFEARPLLVNVGFTPANNVRFTVKVKIFNLETDNLDDFDFTLDELPDTGPSLSPRDEFFISAVLSDFVEESEVEAIKTGIKETLFVWGKVFYQDVFGETHLTKFANYMHWRGDNIWGNPARLHNWVD